MPLAQRHVKALLIIGKFGDGLMTNQNAAPKMRQKLPLPISIEPGMHLKGAHDVPP
jgi:hypothetical protein